MSDRLVLIDSSVWISYLLGHKRARARSVENLLQNHQVAINAIIQAELLTGARDEAQYAELEDSFEGLHFLDLTDAVWKQAERLRFELRRDRYLIPLSDVLIACCTLVYQCELLHADRHFDQIAHSMAMKIHHR